MDYLPPIFLFLIFSFSEGFRFYKKGSDKVSDNVGDIIWNGRNATQGQFKYMVSIQILTTERYHHCGGAIIDPKWVITCAHCKLPIYSLSDFGIEAGSVKLYEGYLYNVSRYIIHPRYKIEPHYDIGLIEIKEKFDFRRIPNIDTIKLYNHPDIPIAEQITTMGWGMNQNHEYPKNLQYLTQLFIKKCDKYDNGDYDNRLICCSHEAKYSTCAADSGGPAIYKYKLVGVVNGGGETCDNGAQNYFARIYFHKTWILGYVKNNNMFV